MLETGDVLYVSGVATGDQWLNSTKFNKYLNWFFLVSKDSISAVIFENVTQCIIYLQLAIISPQSVIASG